MKSITLLIAFANVIDNVIESNQSRSSSSKWVAARDFPRNESDKSITLLLFKTKILIQKR